MNIVARQSPENVASNRGGNSGTPHTLLVQEFDQSTLPLVTHLFALPNKFRRNRRSPAEHFNVATKGIENPAANFRWDSHPFLRIVGRFGFSHQLPVVLTDRGA